RTAKIEQMAEERGVKNAKAKDGLGAASREGKRHGMTFSDLLAAWGVRLTPEEKVLISKVAFDKDFKARIERITPAKAFDEAEDKLFARASVLDVKRLVAESLRFGVGQFTPEAAWRELGRRDMIVRPVKGEVLCTSYEVLAEEVLLINAVRDGRGR